MSDMSKDEFIKLQREAEERMREMQRRSTEISGIPAPDFVKPLSTQKTAPPKTGTNILRLLRFNNLTLDSDRALLLSLLLLLSGDCNDELLLLALVYIML